jgi:hypothetical protein
MLRSITGRGYNFPMTDNPDLQRLAARYLDLWQEQVASMAGDPALSELMVKSFGMVKERWDEAAQQFGQGGGDRHSAQSSGAAASAVSPDVAGLQPGLLLERIALLEERVAQLEQALVGRGKRAAGAGKPRRSGKLPKSAG